jgi:DNA-binding NarL/FixJ family response regulator
MNGDIKILIVEDEVISAMCIQMDLREKGYEVYKPVSTGEEAIEIVKKDSPNIVLMDIGLAGEIDGIETAKQITSFCKIPIIFITGYPDEELRERVKDLNPAGYFLKPLDIEQVESTINHLKNY